MKKERKRFSQRRRLQHSIQLRRNYGRKQEDAYLLNISKTGAYIRYPKHGFNINEKLHLDLKVKDRQRPVAASVVWVHPLGVGLRFLPVNGQDEQIVDDFIYFVDLEKKKSKNILENIFHQI